jgi:hypothetical protein
MRCSLCVRAHLDAEPFVILERWFQRRLTNDRPLCGGTSAVCFVCNASQEQIDFADRAPSCAFSCRELATTMMTMRTTQGMARRPPL